MTNQSKKTKRDLYQEVTAKMIALLEKGVSPWRCTWNQYGLACNYATGHIYSGINAILMNLTEHPIPYFLSFKQAKAIGGKIRKGAKAEMVYFFKPLFKNRDDNYLSREEAKSLRGMEEEVQVIPMLKYYCVFNVQDVEGIKIDIPEVKLQDHERIAECEAIVQNMPNAPKYVFEDANKAFYNPISDKINMPDLKQFTTPEDYYLTFFHEMVHATGHTSRLNRLGVTVLNSFGSPGYSREELTAEMGASFLAAHTGINSETITENSAAYLQGWMSALKKDKKLIFRAAAEAQRAVDFILGVERSYSV